MCGRPSRRPAYGLYPMSWMTLPLPFVAAAVLQPVERQAEVGDGVADEVEDPVGVHRDEQRALLGVDGQTRGGEPFGEPVDALLDLDGDPRHVLRHRRERGRAQQPAALDRDELVADPLDLAEQV